MLLHYSFTYCYNIKLAHALNIINVEQSNCTFNVYLFPFYFLLLRIKHLASFNDSHPKRSKQKTST